MPENSPRVVFTAAAAALAAALSCDASGGVILNGGFETAGAVPRGWQNTPGKWGGDRATIVGADRGVNPYEGASMLRFDYAGGGASAGLTSSDIYQTINLTDATSDIQGGMMRATVSVRVNRVAGDAQTDTKFGLGIHAYSGAISKFASDVNKPLDLVREFILTDSDESTWELITAEMLLPTSTKYVGVWIGAQENIFNDASGVEFDGHYADAVTFALAEIPAPGAMALFAAGGVLAVRRRRARG